MHIKFVAFESLGVRSQATFIQVREANIFIDPSAALAPRRYGLPPHIVEVKRLAEVFDEISDLIRDSDILIYTHYHYDHHEPGRFLDPELYRGKIVYLKDPANNINYSQRVRASRFLNILSSRANSIHIADGSSRTLGSTRIIFSKPLPHGESTRLGYVIGVCIEEEYGVLFTSDIEGGPLEDHRELLEICSPRIAVIDGPPLYLLGHRYSNESLSMSVEFIKRMLDMELLEQIVLDHHVCRDLQYREKLAEVFNKAKALGKEILTAAEASRLKPMLLEASRRDLYREQPEDGLGILKSLYREPDRDLEEPET